MQAAAIATSPHRWRLVSDGGGGFGAARLKGSSDGSWRGNALYNLASGLAGRLAMRHINEKARIFKHAKATHVALTIDSYRILSLLDLGSVQHHET